MLPEKIFKASVGDHEITVGTGKLAEQAGGAVTIRMGDSMLLATATMSKSAREGLNFFPLMVDFEERIYAAGRIPGSFFRREGRPSTEGILTSRVTDRSLRPLFPDGMRNEVQVTITALSSDTVHQLDMMSLNAASAALMISNIPWNGPVGAVRVGYIDGEFVVNPTIPEMENSQLDLRMAGTREAIIMVEAGANELPEDLMVEALAFGHQSLQPLIDLQFDMQAAVGKEKDEPVRLEYDDSLKASVFEHIGDRMATIIRENTDRYASSAATDELREETVAAFVADEPEVDVNAIHGFISESLKKEVRKRTVEERIRADGRGPADIRELSSEVGISPRAHGSGLFRRGETQVLSIATLGTPREAQKLDGLFPLDSRRFMHHYNFPPYSTGETWPLRGPKRREIGHGMLGATAIAPVLPSEDEFPYTIRIVSEVLSSNGSTSQGSICAAILALMDCGVPIRRPVAGVAMGLIKEGDKYVVLSDIQGLEDHIGDMDFKVAGTTEGITALQMDIKIGGLSKELMAEALDQAREGRLEILDSMLSTLDAPRARLSDWAPRMETIKIDPEAIGAIIGKGGSTVRSIQETYEVAVDIQEDGTVFVAGVDGKKTDEALAFIKRLAKGPELGEIMTGKVVRITDFGAFVEIMPGTDGLIHISQMSDDRIDRVEDAVRMGDEVMAMITDVDPGGKIRLSRKAVISGWTLEEARDNDPAVGRRGGGRGRSDRNGGGRGRGGRNDRNDRSGGRGRRRD